MAESPDPTNPFLTRALTRWGVANTFEGPMRTEGEKDLQFLNLEQWEKTIIDQRGESRPCLTIDQIGEPYRQLVGQMRASKPSLQITPVDSGADIDTAEAYQGLIRHVEQTGGAKAAREEAFKGAVGPGWGYYRLYTDFEYSDSPDPIALFDQCIKYKPIENAFTVFRDPSTPLHEPWKCHWALHVEDLPTEDFTAQWPEALATNADCFAATGLAMPDWYPEGAVRVADYFYLEEQDDPNSPEMALLADGRVVPFAQAPAGVAILQRRRRRLQVVKLAKITGAEILEGNEDKTAGREQPWPFIPIVPIWGESLTVKGKRSVRGIVRAARDAQRAYNYQVAELVYELALSPKSKVVMAEGQDEGYTEMWKRAASEAYPALKYKPVSLLGQPVPPPQVANFTDPLKIQALVVAINQAKADLRSTTGWYDATDPSRANTEQSGRAILARKESQAEGAVNYKDSFGSALLFEGMLLLGAIPKVYHRQNRVLRIVGLEDETETEEVTVGQPRKTRKSQRGVQGIFQWGAGRYDVVPSVGASYTTRRQEAADLGMQLLEVLGKTHPPMAAAVAPMVIRQMDIPSSREIADRADRTLPPEVRGQEQDQDDPEAMQAQLAQMQQQMQEAQQMVGQMTKAIETDQVKAEAEAQRTQQSDDVKLKIAVAELQAKGHMEQAKIAAEIRVAQMKIDAEFRLAQFKAGVETRLQDDQQAHEAAQGSADAALADRMADVGHAHEMEAGEMGHRQAMEEQMERPPNGSASA